jgi:hypothetical protein
MRKMPGSKTPMMSPAKPSSTRGALLRQELHRVGEADVAAEADVIDLHPALVAARADAEERDAVAVRAIHVRLDLEDERW